MIKVLNIISDTNIGGAGKCIINFSKNFDSKNYEIVIVLPKGSALVKELEGTKAKVIEIDGLKDKSLDFKSLFKLRKIIKQEKPDIVHTHASSIARVAARLVKGTRVIYTRHCAYPVSDRIKKGVGRFLYKNVNEYFSDRIIAVGYAAEENLLDGGIAKEKIDTFFNGVEKIKTTSEEERKKLRKQYNIADDEYVVGILARLEFVKGHDTFIDAANILLKEKKIKAKFFIIGTGTEEERLKNKVKELGLEKEIIFTGFIKNVGDYLNIFDVQVNCSFGTETSSLSLLEGMSIGVPAVASDYGGNPYLIFDNENGYIVPIKDAEKVANAVEKILTNAETKEKMQQRSIEIFNERFTIQKYVSNVQGVYKKVMEQPKRKGINILDVIIILIAIVAGVVGYSLMNNGEVVETPNTSKVVYSIKATSCLPEVEKYLEEGSTVYDSLKNYNIGTILEYEIEPNEVLVPDLTTGTVKPNIREDRIDIMLTIEANATQSDRLISIGDYEIKVGQEAYVRGKGYAFSGYIVSIER
ncbi:MAG: DUF4330 family protein [Clostridia bacterium]|nr:DUF4330 family protein [Clostridia bacterium]